MNDFGTLEGILENAHQIKQKGRREKIIEHAEMARISRRLVELDRSIPLEKMDGISKNNFDQLQVKPLNKESILGFLDEMQFYDLKRKTLSMFGMRR